MTLPHGSIPLPRLCLALLVALLCHLLLVNGLAYPRQPEKCADGLAGAAPSLSGGSASSTQDAPAGYSTVKASYSRGFLVRDYESFKLVHLNSSGEVYCLYQAGTAPPSRSMLPTGTKMFSVPLSSISVIDASSVAFMAELGVLQHIKYVTDMASDPCMQRLALPKAQSGCGRRAEAPDVNTRSGRNLLKRQVAEVDAVWVDGTAEAGSYVRSKSVAFRAGDEASPLARAEWLKLAALFFGKELHADGHFGNISGAYLATRDAVLRHTAGSAGRRPLVAWTAAAAHGEVELLLGGGYEAHLTQDAGGDALQLPAVEEAAAAAGASLRCRAPRGAQGSPGLLPCTPQSAAAVLSASTPAGAAALLRLLRQVDIIIDTTPWPGAASPTLDELLAAYALPPESAASLPAYRSRRIYRPDARRAPPPRPAAPASLDWHHTGMARPDLTLEDLVMALHPGTILPASAAPAFLRSVAQPHAGGAGDQGGVGQLGPQLCTLLLPGCTMQPQGCPYVLRDASSGQLRYSTASICAPTRVPTALLPAATAAAPGASPAANSSLAVPDNGAAALRPLLLVFLMIVALIEGLIHLF